MPAGLFLKNQMISGVLSDLLPVDQDACVPAKTGLICQMSEDTPFFVQYMTRA
jgi:hypothetical protein